MQVLYNDKKKGKKTEGKLALTGSLRVKKIINICKLLLQENSLPCIDLEQSIPTIYIGNPGFGKGVDNNVYIGGC